MYAKFLKSVGDVGKLRRILIDDLLSCLGQKAWIGELLLELRLILLERCDLLFKTLTLHLEIDQPCKEHIHFGLPCDRDRRFLGFLATDTQLFHRDERKGLDERLLVGEERTCLFVFS